MIHEELSLLLQAQGSFLAFTDTHAAKYTHAVPAMALLATCIYEFRLLYL